MRDAPTPSMQQYLRAKAEYPDCIVFFRMGDFYETFYEDAVETSRILDIALTSRNRDDPNPIPMAGVPWHSASQYIARLVAAGKRVAICEQMEDPKQAKGLVRREVVRVITPGVLLDTEMPDPSQPHHLVSLHKDDRGFGIAALDATTGALLGAEARDQGELSAALSKFSPREVLVEKGLYSEVEETLAPFKPLVTEVSEGMLKSQAPDEERLLDGAVPAALRLAVRAILSYLARTNAALLATTKPLELLSLRETLLLPPSTVRNLEIVSTSLEGRAHGSLLQLLDETRTPMGSRLLRAWLLGPLVDVQKIEARLDRVEALVKNPLVRAGLREALRGTPDVERLLTRLASGSATARDLLGIARTVKAAMRCRDELNRIESVQYELSVPEELVALAEAVSNTFVSDPPASTRDGGMVKRGVNEALDQALDMAENGRRYLLEYEARERERTGIPSLKVRYNRVFGYAIEVSRSAQSRVPSDYQRRQTLANAERYVTEELSRLEQQIVTADERAKQIELEIFEEYRSKVLAETARLQAMAVQLATLDVLAALAEVAHKRGYCRPKVTSGRSIKIVQGRHPTVEAALPPGAFIPNDFEMDGSEVIMHIITGPNMAGKSTVMRQVALMVVMAQMGSFVPADAAEIGVADAVFTRIGAADDIVSGRSTFMVEMAEAADILSRASDRSLVILDEIGRGTSTFDGVAIAWAIAEYIHNRIGCRTLFATHYHELTDLVRVLPKARNFSVAVKEWGGKVLFLRKLVDGPANRSYGIQVARLAALPEEVLDRAREVLANLEAGEWDIFGIPVLARSRRKKARVEGQLDLFGVSQEQPDPLVEGLARLDVNRMTPLEALRVLADMVEAAKKRIGGM